MKKKSIRNIARHYRVLLDIIKIRRKRKSLKIRRWWVKPHLKKRNIFGAYKTLFLYFKNHDHEEFKKLTRLTVRQFDKLYILLKPKLQKFSYREPLHPELRLAAVIW